MRPSLGYQVELEVEQFWRRTAARRPAGTETGPGLGLNSVACLRAAKRPAVVAIIALGQRTWRRPPGIMIRFPAVTIGLDGSTCTTARPAGLQQAQRCLDSSSMYMWALNFILAEVRTM